MTMLMRWNPYREMLSLREQMNRLFDRSFGEVDREFALTFMNAIGVDMDVVERDDAFVVKATVPGIDAEQLDITLDQNILTVSGEISRDEEQEGELYHLRERRFGRFSRSVHLPAEVDADAVEANLENGVLTVTVPKTEESKPKRIPIGNGQKAIEGQTIATTS